MNFSADPGIDKDIDVDTCGYEGKSIAFEFQID